MFGGTDVSIYMGDSSAGGRHGQPAPDRYGTSARPGRLRRHHGICGRRVLVSPTAGQVLAGRCPASQCDRVLTVLNHAISDVAAQDGYIGAQINTLNAVSQVMSTQQQNIVAAQNAVQATDYAQASSNMSKYQILSQTGISALAQANSLQQEVLKLLQ